MCLAFLISHIFHIFMFLQRYIVDMNLGSPFVKPSVDNALYLTTCVTFFQ